jgi:2-polyprenyl-6-methoxyphenol hydroxylase-like FAD-dependent oxidoreductase
LHILYDAALREPSENSSTAGSVVVEFNIEVVDADFEAGSVTLKSGVVHSGDVLIGADGASGFIRQRMLKEQDKTLEDEPSGLAVYRSVYPSLCRLRRCDNFPVQSFQRMSQLRIRNLKPSTSRLRFVFDRINYFVLKHTLTEAYGHILPGIQPGYVSGISPCPEN